MSSARATTDDRLGELVALQGQLLAAAPAWARGGEVAPAITQARHAALRLNHQRYAALIPAYRRLAEPLLALGEVDLGLVVDNLLFSGLFKSYDPAALQAGDFGAMTQWLGSVFTREIAVDLDAVAGVGDWRTRLRGVGVFLSFSSGTSGRLSFVPRDHQTFRSLVTASATYADPDWPLENFDCLVAGPRGDGMGILDAGNGLARSATRAHFLFDKALSADAVRAAAPDASGAPGRRWLDTGEVDEAYARAFDFIRASAREGRRLLVFGAPFQVLRFCQRIAAGPGRIETPPGSLIATGGGWKSFAGERVGRRELLRLVGDSLGIDAGGFVDAYSTAELSCALRSCREGRYHVPPLLEAVVLDEALTGVVGRPGQGLLAFLDPFAASYPGFLITGDRAVLGGGRCGCGLQGAFIDGEIERAQGMEIRGCGGVLESITV